MADTKISALPSGAPAQAGDEYVVARSGANYKLTLTNIAASMPPIGATTPNTGAFTSLTNGLGAVGTPSYTFTGDLNTGMWSPTADTVAWSTGGSERMRIDSSGNVGIGGTAPAFAKMLIGGTLPAGSANSQGIRMLATIPSGATSAHNSFFSAVSTEAASFTLTNLFHFNAEPQSFGAGSAVTNQYGFYVASSLTGATNNYGFYSNIASGSNRWNFYAAGTARNYFAGRTDVGNTRIEATNNWSGVKIYSETGVSLADGATVTLTSTVCGAVTINVYETASGDGGTFFANYSGTVTKLAGDGAATDTGSTFAVYKSAGSHTLTLKNKYGTTRGFRVSVIGAYVE